MLDPPGRQQGGVDRNRALVNRALRFIGFGRRALRSGAGHDWWRNVTREDVNVIGLLFFGGFAVLFAIGILWHEGSVILDDGGSTASAGVAGATQAPEVDEVYIPPGLRSDEIAALIDYAGIADSAAFLDLVENRSLAQDMLGPDWGEVNSLEGYLAPGSYQLGQGLSAADVVQAMVDKFKGQFPSAWRATAKDRGLSPREVLILASIVQRESIYYSDAPPIAAVFLNRLRAGLSLDSDPTVAYALTLRSMEESGVIRGWSAKLTPEDIQVQSPYNTYLNKGLPPGPISNSSLAAIKAVLWPADTDYMYFTAKPNGAHAFARTLEEQDRNFKLYSFADAATEQHAPGGSASELRDLLGRIIEPLDAHVGVVVKNLATGESASINAGDYFTAASLYKPFVMAYAYQEKEQGRLSFDERMVIPDDAASHDNETVRRRLGTHPTISEALEQLIVVSSSGAGETLLEKFGRQPVEGFLRDHGLRDTSLSEAGIVTTPNDVANFMEQLANEQLVSSQASSDMLDVMSRQEFNDLLRKYMPTDVVFAHKTASLDYPSHDAGILYTSTGPVIIVVMTEDATDKPVASETIAQVGKFIYDYYESYRPTADAMAEAPTQFCGEQPDTAGQSGPLAGRVIILDPRAGSAEEGRAVKLPTGSALTEGDLTLDIAQRLKSLLLAEGATVYLTRCGAEAVPDLDKAVFANQLLADLFVTLGVNIADDPNQDAVGVKYMWQDGRVLGNYILGTFSQPALWKSLAGSLSLTNAGAEAEEIEALRFTGAPGVVTESVDISNPKEASLLQDVSGLGNRRDQIAKGHLKGVVNYFESLFSAQ